MNSEDPLHLTAEPVDWVHEEVGFLWLRIHGCDGAAVKGMAVVGVVVSDMRSSLDHAAEVSLRLAVLRHPVTAHLCHAVPKVIYRYGNSQLVPGDSPLG